MTNPFAPPFEPCPFSDRDRDLLAPFFTNLDQSVYGTYIFGPEMIGALCSRASRAHGDLRKIFLNEYLLTSLNPERTPKDTEESWEDKLRYAMTQGAFLDFLKEHPLRDLFAHPRARQFFVTWLAQYGDDSIAQMASVHIVFASLSQVATKHLENQRIGLAPIEKSSRYVDFGRKIEGHYPFYADPSLAKMGKDGLLDRYRATMDRLFETYLGLIPRLVAWLVEQYPDVQRSVIEKKALDTLRGLLPMATLTQVAFHGNGQAFEYAAARSLQHPLGEVQWAGQAIVETMNQLAPAFVRRLVDPSKAESAKDYQRYLGERRERVAAWLPKRYETHLTPWFPSDQSTVRLQEWDPKTETKLLAAMLYDMPGNHATWDGTLAMAEELGDGERASLFEAYFSGRTERWQKVGRALENSFVRFEVVMDIGAWRDLQRHRMLTQQHQLFSCHHGLTLPATLEEAGLAREYLSVIHQAEDTFAVIETHSPWVAQYTVPMAMNVRAMFYMNLRECFWMLELRTIPEGHPSYRETCQQMFRELERVFPTLTQFMRVNLESYDFARRGQEERLQSKLHSLGQPT